MNYLPTPTEQLFFSQILLSLFHYLDINKNFNLRG